MNPSSSRQSGGPGRDDTIFQAASQEHMVLQQRLWSLCQSVQRQPGIPQGVAHSLVAEVRDICQGFNHRQMTIQRDRDAMLSEINTARDQMREKTRLLQNALRERDRACRERDEMETETVRQSKQLEEKENIIKESQLKMQKSREQLRSNEANLLRINQELRDKVKIQEDQINGKRALWLENHPTSSVRRPNSQVFRDPFTTPSGSHPPGRGIQSTSGGRDSVQQTPAPLQQALMASSSPPHLRNSSFGGSSGFVAPPSFGGPSNLVAPSNIPQLSSAAGPSSSVGPSRTLRFEHEMPTGPARKSTQNWQSMPVSGSAPGSRADYTGSDEIGNQSGSGLLVPYKSDDELAEEFKEAILKEWSMIEDWTKTYTHIPNPGECDTKVSQNHGQWDFMMKCLGTRLADAHNQVIALLRSEDHRRFFIFRMIVQYVVTYIWDISNYCGHDDVSTEILVRTKEGLLQKGLLPAERCELVSQQQQTMKALEACDDFQAYRAFRLQSHTKALREMLGPLLNLGVIRQEAGSGVGSIAVFAFDVGVKMFTSGWAFRYVFTRAGDRFAHTSMIHRDNLLESSLSMQIRQARLRLCITPVITMRKDSDSGIICPKQVAHAQVLIAT